MSTRTSPWRTEVDLPAIPRREPPPRSEVVVVGGGIVGLTTALLLRRQGAEVTVLEARRLGSGTTLGTTGKVTSQHSLIYADLARRRGESVAEQYAQANQAATELVASLAAEVGADGAFVRAPAYVVAMDGSEHDRLHDELEVARRLGLPATLRDECDLPFAVNGALRFDHQGCLHAGRYLSALAAELLRLGVEVVEGTRVTAVEEHDDHVEVRTDSTAVQAGHVVMATLLPIGELGGYFAKVHPHRAYGIAVRLASGGIEGMHINVGSPTRSTRPWTPPDGGTGIVVVGEDHPTGTADASPSRWGALERWARDHFDVASIDQRWSAQDFTTVDRVPFIGRAPRSERVLVGTGFGKWGLSGGTAAAMICADLLAGRPNPWLEAFDPTRLGGPAAVAELAKDNAVVGAHFVADRVARLGAPSLEQVAPGTGAIARSGSHAVAAYRAPDGELQTVSATCSHLGCTLHWNRAEQSWDCPCHGSRFDVDGQVLDGPGVTPLGE